MNELKLKCLSQETIEKIERCLYRYNQTCEVKIEHGEQTVIAISRKKMRSAEAQAKSE